MVAFILKTPVVLPPLTGLYNPPRQLNWNTGLAVDLSAPSSFAGVPLRRPRRSGVLCDVPGSHTDVTSAEDNYVRLTAVSEFTLVCGSTECSGVRGAAEVGRPSLHQHKQDVQEIRV